MFDLRAMKVPIVLFASMGDNITPPEQAFNWVADVYGSTEEIKANGQVIVGLVHKDIGHLGIFVSGKVAKKEHAQIVNVMEVIEALPPGLYAMHITERKGAGAGPQYEVDFEERRLEDVVKNLNRLQRADEKPFEAVAAVSDFNQRAYELFARPLVQALSTEFSGQLQRTFHPLRMQRWAISDLNPALWWLKPAAAMVKQQRKALPADHPLRKNEKLMSELTSAAMDYHRALRDALSESQFFQLYGNLFSLYLADRPEFAPGKAAGAGSARAARGAGGAGCHRAGRLCRGHRARRLPAGAQGRAAAAVAPAAEEGADRRLQGTAAGDLHGRGTQGPRRTGTDRALRARAGGGEPGAAAAAEVGSPAAALAAGPADGRPARAEAEAAARADRHAGSASAPRSAAAMARPRNGGCPPVPRGGSL
jgi:hypothetical protein